MYQDFEMVQPFKGGRTFVTMQAVGYTAYAVTIGFSMEVLLNDTIPTAGLGALGFAASAILILSLDQWKGSSDNLPVAKNSTRSYIGILIVCICFVVCVGKDAGYVNESYRKILNSCGFMCMLVALFIHGSGIARIADHEIFSMQIFDGGFNFQILQGLSWTLIGSSLFAAFILPSSYFSSTKGALSLFGGFALTGNIVLWISFNHYINEFKSNNSRRSKVLALACSASVLSHGVAWNYAHHVALFAIFPVIGHGLIGGIIWRHQGFRIYQPFVGGIAHVLLQAVGWFIFAVMAYSMNTNISGDVVTLKRLSLVSHILILASVYQFEPEICPPKPQVASSNSESSVYIKWTANTVCFVTFSALILNDAYMASPKILVISPISFALIIFSTYVDAFGGSFAGLVTQWRPFQSHEFFVMCEAISLTVFAVCLLANFLLLEANQTYLVGWSSCIGCGYLFSYATMRYGASFLRGRKYVKGTFISNPQPKAPKGVLYNIVLLIPHSSLLFFVAEEMNGNQVYLYGVLVSLIGVIANHFYGVFFIPGFKLFMPFQGGPNFVVLQTVGWILFSTGCVTTVVLYNEHSGIAGVYFSVGLLFYCGQLSLLRSRNEFIATSIESFKIDPLVGMLLGFVSILLFLCVDFAVIRFGIAPHTAQIITGSAWVSGCVSVPLAAFVQLKQKDSSFDSPVLVILVSLTWTFTLILGAVLLTSNLYESLSRSAWSGTAAGFAHVISHLVIRSQTPSHVPMYQYVVSIIPITLISGVLIWIAVKLFSHFILPVLRAFLDYPMHKYAMIMKTQQGWISPDGIQALENVRIERNVRYGNMKDQLLDILRPLDPNKVFVCPDDLKILAAIPVLYCHGGGHICVRREVLAHSVTPLVRSGVSVYSVEYPLSPESKYPTAALSVIRAIRWVMLHHCSNPDCVSDCSVHTETGIFAHQCTSKCTRAMHDEICFHCGHSLGTNQVQLMGDSAGASLVAMATAALHNPTVLQTMIALDKQFENQFQDLLGIDFPEVLQTALLYGLMGREVPDLFDNTSGDSFLWRLVCYTGINFIYKLYDPLITNIQITSSLNDLQPDELKYFASKTLMICGKSDPLLPSNVSANERLSKYGHDSELHLFPGTHAFHGFPALWMRYIGADWEKNARPATILLMKFFTLQKLDTKKLEAQQGKQVFANDFSPLVIFPLFFIVLPAIVLLLAL